MHQIRHLLGAYCMTRPCLCYSGRPQYNHVGEVVDGVDMRAEVALLSRNILIYGEMENSCYGNNMCQFYNHDTFGGHIKVCVLVLFYITGSCLNHVYPDVCACTFQTLHSH